MKASNVSDGRGQPGAMLLGMRGRIRSIRLPRHPLAWEC
jgi:hypothetical protein